MNSLKKMPFQKKIILCMILIITAAMLIVACGSFFVIRNTLNDRINREISATLTSKAQEFDKWIFQQQSILSYFGDTIEYNNFLESCTQEQLEELLASKVSENVIDYYIVKPDKTTIFASGFVLPDDFDVTARDWYKATIAANGEMTCTSPYIDNNTGKLCMTISVAYFTPDKQLEFVLGADIYADYLADITNSVNVFDNAYTMLLDDSLNVIVHRNEEYAMSVNDDGSAKVTSLRDIPTYSTLVSQIEADDSAMLNIGDFDGTSRYFIPAKISSTDWYYVYAVNSSEYLIQTVPVMAIMMILLIVVIVVSAVVITVILKRLMQPIDELKAAAVDMKCGKLSYTPTYTAEDSIGELCGSIAETNKVWTGYINDINSNLDKLSHGNFDVRFNGDYVGDFAEIKASIANIAEKLEGIIEGIDTAAAEVSTDSMRLAESSTTLAAGVHQQSQTIDEITALTENLVKQIDDNAASAEAAQKQSGITSENVVECNRRMTELIESMDNINEKAQEIVKIVQTIDDIAFQTNMLALNAAIEAARAGAAGKGFAVVADEVRNLASKCAQAVQNTTALITSTGEAVENGSKLAQETGTALRSVSQGVENVNNIVVKISHASEIQANDVKNVSDKLASIDDIIHTTAITAEHSAASSEELSGQSQTLKDIVDKFRKR